MGTLCRMTVLLVVGCGEADKNDSVGQDVGTDAPDDAGDDAPDTEGDTADGTPDPPDGPRSVPLLVDTQTGSPVSLNYGPRLVREPDEQGRVATVRLPFLRTKVPDEVRAYVMVGAYPAFRDTVTIPAQ